MTGTMKRLWGIILTVALFLQPIGGGELDEYVSHPGNIPDFYDFKTPQIEPGENAYFEMSVKNRYQNSIENVSIHAEIYQRADIDSSEAFENIDSEKRPYIGDKCWKTKQPDDWNCGWDVNDGQNTVSFEFGELKSNTSLQLKFSINSKEDTKEGTYFVRFGMNFDYNGTSRVMQSRGHWSMNLWEEATTNVTENSPGNIDLEKLEVDGIIPDSSFGIKKPIPKWPLYVLISLTILFASLAIVFYLEEEGTYPELNKWLQKQRGKLNQLRLRFEYRKGR